MGDHCNKRKKPLPLDWEEHLPTAAGDDDRPPELVVTSAKKPKDDGGDGGDAEQTEDEDYGFRMMTDCELKDTITRVTKNIQLLSSILPDKGEKLKANLRRHKAEAERRAKLRYAKGDNGCEETIQLSDQSDDGTLCGKKKDGGGDGGDAEQTEDEDYGLRMITDCELEDMITMITKNILLLSRKLPDKGEKLKANLKRHKAEAERRAKLRSAKGDNGCEETIQLPDQSDDGTLCGKKKDGGGDGGDVEPTEDEDYGLRMITDCELEDRITMITKNILFLSRKLPDKGEKLKANLQTHKDEAERRAKLQSAKGDNGCEETIQLSDQSDDDTSCGKKKDDGGVGGDAEQTEDEDYGLRMITDRELEDRITRVTKNIQSLSSKLPDKGEMLKAYIRRHKAEAERRAKLRSTKACDHLRTAATRLYDSFKEHHALLLEKIVDLEDMIKAKDVEIAWVKETSEELERLRPHMTELKNALSSTQGDVQKLKDKLAMKEDKYSRSLKMVAYLQRKVARLEKLGANAFLYGHRECLQAIHAAGVDHKPYLMNPDANLLEMEFSDASEEEEMVVLSDLEEEGAKKAKDGEGQSLEKYGGVNPNDSTGPSV